MYLNVLWLPDVLTELQGQNLLEYPGQTLPVLISWWLTQRGVFRYTRCKSSQQQWLLGSFESVLEQDDGGKAIPKSLYDKSRFTRDFSTI